LTSDACAQIKPGSSELASLPGQICAPASPLDRNKTARISLRISHDVKEQTPHPRTPFNKRCVQMR